MNRRDRQGVRTPTDLELKYDFTQSFNALEKRQRNSETAQTQFENETEEALASLKESAADTNAALSTFNQRLTKTEKNALRLELAIKNMGGNTGSGDLSQIEQELEETNKQLEELSDKVSEMGQTGAPFTTDETLTLEDGVLKVNTASKVEEDNTLPITAAAVHTTVGNIEILLATI